MSIFLGVHKLPEELTEQEVEEGYEKYKQSAIKSGLKPLFAVYSKAKGFAYCQTEADSVEQVKKAHEAVEIPLEDVIEVKSIQ